MFDISKRVFLSLGCTRDQKKLNHIMEVLEKYKVQKNNIIKEIDMDMMRSGDYLIRCLNAETKLYEIRLTHPFGFTTHFIENL